MLIGIAGGIPFNVSNSLGRQIAALFAQGEKGVHFDPSDLTTLFQDSAGTTPVTAAGQTVGLMLDKSQGLVLGPELVTTQDLTNAAWVSGGAFGSWSGTTATANTITSTATGGARRYRFACVPGQVVQASALLQRLGTATGADIAVAFGTSALVLISVRETSVTGGATPTNVQLIVTAPDTAAYCEMIVRVQGPAGSQASFNNISVKELPGYHATQDTSTARPILGRHPINGRRNLLTYTEDFSNAVWGKLSAGTGTVPVVTSNYAAAPDGTLTASRIQLNKGAGATIGDYSLLSYVVGVSGTSSVWVKSTDGVSSYVITLDGLVLDRTVSGTWQQVSGVTGGTSFRVMLRGGQTLVNSDAADILIWHPQAESGSVATNYQKVVSTYDVTEAGVNDAYYLKFDGVDDFMVTPSIDFSATDKMSVFAGVRKLSDSAAAFIAYFTNDYTTAVGWTLRAPNTASATFGANVSGSIGNQNIATAANYAAPYSAVVSLQTNLALADASLRVNGSNAAQDLNLTVGAGPYANAPLYIGRGALGSTLNGHLYSLVVRGALSDASQIASGEVYCNSKTGAY